MNPLKKLHNRRGFTLAELLIVVAIIALLAGIAFAFVNPSDISYLEYDRDAEAIATAAQNRLTEIRNTGGMERLRTMGEKASASGVASTAYSDDTPGGYRYIFNYTEEGGSVVRNADIAYILPFGAIDQELAQNYYAIGFQSDTGMVGEVFYSEKPFAARTVEYLMVLKGSEEQRKADAVGYYEGTVSSDKVAFANLPTPQLTVTNYEDLTLSIYLPEVRQLQDMGKGIGILVSLADENGEAYKGEAALDLTQTAIYSTFALGTDPASMAAGGPVVLQDVALGSTYRLVLDTVVDKDPVNGMSRTFAEAPVAPFEKWASRTAAFGTNFLLGQNVKITVTVYALNNEGDENYSAASPIDPTFMPRSATVVLNGWFNDYRTWYDSDDKAYYATVDIACGRHLQNLANITEIRSNMQALLPKVTETKTEGGEISYTYSDYNRGKASAYTDGSSHAVPPVSSSDYNEKYVHRSMVDPKLMYANQVNAIDFNCAEWRNSEGKPVPFSPIYLPDDFRYYGNYLTINHLYVDAPFYAGLFGYVYDARLYDILLVNPSVNSQMPKALAEMYEMGVGALVGTSRDSDYINNCQAYLTQENGSFHPEKYRVTGECYVGGLIGFCEDEHINNCSASVHTGYAEGTTRSDGTPLASLYVGGLVGCITGDSTIGSCYAAGNLSGEYVGGLVGYIMEDSDPSGDDYRIESCYTAGHIEYASKSASGLIGNIRERMGVAKSALSVYGNYCAIIYGKNIGSNNYVWTGRLADGSPVPIYGTFRGDNFEWVRTESLGFSNTYLTGKYADVHYYFGGAVFADDDKNYYIAQRGIEYSHSPYYEAISATVKQLADSIASANTSTAALLAQVEKARDKLYWLKKLQALEEVKGCVEDIIAQVEEEVGLDYEGEAYNLAGSNLYLDRVRSRIYYGVSSSNDDKNSPQVTLVEALHAIYNGKYTDTSGTEHEDLFTYEGSTNELKNTVTGIPSYTFMSFYNELKQAYNDLADDSTANDAAALKKVRLIVGDDSANAAEGGDTQNAFYMNGLLYRIFVRSMFYSVFDVAKDHYQDNNDLYGEIMYRYYREDMSGDDGNSGQLKQLVVELGISRAGHDKFLSELKLTNLQEAIDALADYPTIIDKWNGDMASLTVSETDKTLVKTLAKTLATTVNTELGELKTAVETKTVGSKALADAVQEAFDALYDLWALFEKYKNVEDVVDTAGKVKNMRSLRDPIQNYYLKYVLLCGASGESGIDLALTELGEQLKETGANRTALANEFAERFAGFYGSDSGHRIENTADKDASQKLLEAMIDYSVDKLAEHKDWEGDPDYGFMYDYGKHYSTTYNPNPYEKKLPEGSYVNGDCGVYNNVFPYIEGDDTSFYPFPFVFARKVEVEQGDRFRSVFVLFHYGDWLTPDLWATEGEGPDAATVALYETYAQMESIYQELQNEISDVGNRDTTGKFNKSVTALSDAIASCQEMAGNAMVLTEPTRSEQLGEIESTISGWLDGGVFSDLEKACNSTKKEIAAIVEPKLAEFRTALEALVGDIKKALGRA